jgi:hypothetical protein
MIQKLFEDLKENKNILEQDLLRLGCKLLADKGYYFKINE